MTEPDTSGMKLEVVSDGTTSTIEPNRVFLSAVNKIDIPASPIFKINPAKVADLDPEAMTGKVVLIEMPDLRSLAPNSPEARTVRAAIGKAVQSRAALIVSTRPESDSSPWLRDLPGD